MKKEKNLWDTQSKGEVEFRKYIKSLLKENSLDKKYKVKKHVLFKLCKNKNVQKNVDVVVYEKSTNKPVLLVEYDGQPHLVSYKTISKDYKANNCMKLNKDYKLLRLKGDIFQKYKDDERFKSFLLNLITSNITGIIKVYDEKTAEELLQQQLQN